MENGEGRAGPERSPANLAPHVTDRSAKNGCSMNLEVIGMLIPLVILAAFAVILLFSVVRFIGDAGTGGPHPGRF